VTEEIPGEPIPADGQAVWRVTTKAGTRLLRTRKGGTPVPLAAGTRAAQVTWLDADEFTGPAPVDLRGLYRLAEASRPRYGWAVWRIGPAGDPAAWIIQVELPDGAEQRYTWVRDRGRMVPVCAVEVDRAAELLAGEAAG
jgi:hypothetical protein